VGHPLAYPNMFEPASLATVDAVGATPAFSPTPVVGCCDFVKASALNT
jgi:hypothetical protein